MFPVWVQRRWLAGCWVFMYLAQYKERVTEDRKEHLVVKGNKRAEKQASREPHK